MVPIHRLESSIVLDRSSDAITSKSGFEATATAERGSRTGRILQILGVQSTREYGGIAGSSSPLSVFSA